MGERLVRNQEVGGSSPPSSTSEGPGNRAFSLSGRDRDAPAYPADDFHSPVYTFYSDGNHALVSGSNPRTVSIMDSLFGLDGPSVPRPPAGAGQGNLNVIVSIS